MHSTCLRWWSICLLVLRWRSSRSQSISCPSAIASASGRRSSSIDSPLLAHQLGEAHKSPRDEHSGCIRRRSTRCLGDRLIGVLELGPHDERLALILCHSPERILIPIERLLADRLFERRGLVITRRLQEPFLPVLLVAPEDLVPVL